jgi:hypothetical protein
MGGGGEGLPEVRFRPKPPALVLQIVRGEGKGEITNLIRKMRRLGSELNLSTRDCREAVEVDPSKRLIG